MLHLLPLRSIGRFAFAVTVLSVIAVVFFLPVESPALGVALPVLRWVLLGEAAAATVFFYFWHYVPGLTSRWVFPHIDGTWTGTLYFHRNGSPDTKPATLHVHQSLTRVRLILETDESTSETLVVQPERDPDFSRFRLFYIFENRSRDGLPNTARCYRGTAAMEIQPGRPTQLAGTYFTDQGSEGTFTFDLVPSARKGIAALWHALVGPKGVASPMRPMPRPARST